MTDSDTETALTPLLEATRKALLRRYGSALTRAAIAENGDPAATGQAAVTRPQP